MTARPNLRELLDKVDALDALSRIGMTSAMDLAAGILLGALEAEKASREIMDRRIAEAAARGAMRDAAAMAELTELGVPLEIIQAARRRPGASARR